MVWQTILEKGNPHKKTCHHLASVDSDWPLRCNEFNWDTWNDFSVQVPEIPCTLKCAVDPPEESSCYGIDIYMKSLEIVDERSTLASLN